MRIALLSTSDTDLLSARACGADWVWGNPTRLDRVPEADLLVVRFLGSPHDLPVEDQRLQPLPRERGKQARQRPVQAQAGGRLVHPDGNLGIPRAHWL